MDYRRHFAVEKLEPEAKAAVDDALARGVPYADVARMLEEEFEVKIAISSIGRYATGSFSPQRERLARLRAEAKALLDAYRENPSEDVREFLQAQVEMGIMENQTDLSKADVLKLLREQREREKLALERRRLDIEESKIKLGYTELETRVRVAEMAMARAAERARAVAGQLEGAERAGRSLTAEELKRIREEVYGIREDVSAIAAPKAQEGAA